MSNFKFGRGYIKDKVYIGRIHNVPIDNPTENEMENELITYRNRYRERLRMNVDLEYYRNNLINQFREEYSRLEEQ